MERELYFAYGSNMDEEQMAYRCPNATLFSKGFLPFYRFAIDSAGVATIIPDLSSYVQGILWLVSEDDIKRLDRYEGVDQNCYRKEYIPIIFSDVEGTFGEALVYVSCRPEWGQPSGTGSEYMRRIWEVALKYDFTDRYLDTLFKYAETKAKVIHIKAKQKLAAAK